MEEKFHCYECAGLGKKRGYECSICDGEGNPKKVTKESKSLRKRK